MSLTLTDFEIRVRSRGATENRLRIVEIRYPATVEGDRVMAELLAGLVSDEEEAAKRGDDGVERGIGLRGGVADT